MSRLEGRTAIVTGGARGQGEATVRAFVAEGARVVIVDLLKEEGMSLAQELGSAACFSHMDITDENAWQSTIDKTIDRWETIDILINNAGIVHPAAITELEKEDFQRVLNINLIGAWLGVKTVSPHMISQKNGAIVNICSTSALVGFNGLTAYAASKWALRGLTKTAAMELGHKGIRVNSIFPGGINTGMVNSANVEASELTEYYQGQPIQRIGEPEEVAKTSLFLASDDASYLTGAELVVDGGATIGTYLPQLPGNPTV